MQSHRRRVAAGSAALLSSGWFVSGGGDHSFCLQSQNGALCVQLFHWETKEGCSGTLACQPWFQSDRPLYGRFGACRQP